MQWASLEFYITCDSSLSSEPEMYFSSVSFCIFFSSPTLSPLCFFFIKLQSSNVRQICTMEASSWGTEQIISIQPLLSCRCTKLHTWAHSTHPTLRWSFLHSSEDAALFPVTKFSWRVQPENKLYAPNFKLDPIHPKLRWSFLHSTVRCYSSGLFLNSSGQPKNKLINNPDNVCSLSVWIIYTKVVVGCLHGDEG